MSEPDETMVDAVMVTLFGERSLKAGWHGPDQNLRRREIAAVLSVPVVRDALARDAQVREIVASHAKPELETANSYDARLYERITNLYPSPGDRDDSEEQR